MYPQRYDEIVILCTLEDRIYKILEYRCKQREREREREREIINLPNTDYKKKYCSVFDESTKTWIINEAQTAWNFKKVGKERIYDTTCMARH